MNEGADGDGEAPGGTVGVSDQSDATAGVGDDKQVRTDVSCGGRPMKGPNFQKNELVSKKRAEATKRTSDSVGGG